MVQFQYRQLAFPAHFHITGGDGVDLCGKAQTFCSALQRVAQNLTDGIVIAGELVHIGCRCVSEIVETIMGQPGTAHHLSELIGQLVPPVGASVRLGIHQIVVIVGSAAAATQGLLLLLYLLLAQEEPQRDLCNGQCAALARFTGAISGTSCTPFSSP